SSSWEPFLYLSLLVVMTRARQASATSPCGLRTTGATHSRDPVSPLGRHWAKSAVRASDLLDLAEAELDRGLPAEDLDERLDALRLGVELGDRGVQRRERAVDDHDRVALAEVGDLDRLLGRRRGRAGGRRTRSRGLRLG